MPLDKDRMREYQKARRAKIKEGKVDICPNCQKYISTIANLKETIALLKGRAEIVVPSTPKVDKKELLKKALSDKDFKAPFALCKKCGVMNSRCVC